ncbi:hypothetical protein ACFSC4_28805 [Deinococcus malanensis]
MNSDRVYAEEMNPTVPSAAALTSTNARVSRHASVRQYGRFMA